ncbi:CynX/NimT family MFS transporter [Leucobacter sp. M11]|uniref:CynX/NimT family MFS transporter n=1 Tax=Leucobacter sp. M11 TaxID=2993565 RepID=UPI002D7E2534|nr:MFS transporter [Leucobacter sp. M11]MEB4615126.1 MFS transporter [Leucobacter sp. M11]
MSDANTPDDHLGNERRMRLGRHGLALAGILLIAANLRTGITVVGPLLGNVRDDLGLDSVQASMLITIPVLCFAFFSPIVPSIASRFGMERTLFGALALLAAALIVRPLPIENAIWAGTVMLGLAIGALNVVLPGLLKRDFGTQAGKLTGIYSAVQSGCAGLASGLAVPISQATDWGWRLSFGVWAGLALIAMGVFWPQLAARGKHERTGPIELAARPKMRSPWGSALGWQLTLFMGSQSALFYTLLTWWPSIDEANGFSAAEAGMHQSMFQIIGIGGNLIVGALIARWARDQRPILLMLAPLPLIGLIGQLNFPELSLVWNLVIGVSAGGTIVLALALFGLRATNHYQAASISGMAQSFGYLLAAACPIIVGALHDTTGNWDTVLYFLLGLQVVQITSGVLASRDRLLGGRVAR